MYTVALLQDFSVPLICWCALEITKGALDGLCSICRPTSHNHSSEGTSALQSTVREKLIHLGVRPGLWKPHSSLISSHRALLGCDEEKSKRVWELGKVKSQGLPVVGSLCLPSWAVYSLSMIRAKPKSPILQPNVSDTRMLAALRSRWIEFIFSIYAIPSAIWGNMPQREGQHGNLHARTLPTWGALQSPNGRTHPPSPPACPQKHPSSSQSRRGGKKCLMFIVFGGAWRVVVLEKEQVLGWSRKMASTVLS